MKFKIWILYKKCGNFTMWKFLFCFRNCIFPHFGLNFFLMEIFHSIIVWTRCATWIKSGWTWDSGQTMYFASPVTVIWNQRRVFCWKLFIGAEDMTFPDRALKRTRAMKNQKFKYSALFVLCLNLMVSKFTKYLLFDGFFKIFNCFIFDEKKFSCFVLELFEKNELYKTGYFAIRFFPFETSLFFFSKEFFLFHFFLIRFFLFYEMNFFPLLKFYTNIELFFAQVYVTINICRLQRIHRQKRQSSSTTTLCQID